MACMDDFESVTFRCGYEPCGYEFSEGFYKYDFHKHDTKKCPKCGVFNAKPCLGSDLVKAVMESLKNA